MFVPPDAEKYIEVPVHQLEAGMYVAYLDRPWLESPFAVQGFYVHNEADILEVADACSYVFVDPRRHQRGTYKPKFTNGIDFPGKSNDDATVGLRRDFEAAETDYDSAAVVVRKAFERLKTTGELNVAAVQEAVNPLIDHVIHRKEAVVALVRMKKKDDYLYNHSISTAVIGAMIGQQIGLPLEDLQKLTLGCALIDVGKVKMPDELLNSTGPMTDSQTEAMRKHVAFSLALITRDQEIDQAVQDIVAYHHERWDGSGYPKGAQANEIPLMARIAALADTYDAMTTKRPYAASRSSFDTVQELIDQKDIKFPGVLVEQFVQAIGLFPTGSVVELSTGEVGIVVAQNPTRRLKPKVVVVLDEHKQPRTELVTIDLQKYTKNEEQQVWIKQELPAGAHGIDADALYI